MPSYRLVFSHQRKRADKIFQEKFSQSPFKFLLDWNQQDSYAVHITVNNNYLGTGSVLCGLVIQQVKHGECQSEGKDNVLTVRKAGQTARVLQLFLECWVCESTLNAKLMTLCQNPNCAGLICVCVCLSVWFGTEPWVYICVQWYRNCAKLTCML